MRRVTPIALRANERLVLDAVRLERFGAARLVTHSAYSPHVPSNHVTCESPSKARMCVATRSRNQRSWVITTAQPAKSSSASSSARSVSTSRSLVGSSSSSTLPPLRSSFARCTRFRSPPERSPTGFCWSPPLKLNHDDVLARVDLALAELDRVVAAARSPSRRCSSGRAPPRDWSTYASCTVSPIRSSPRVGLLLAGDHPEERRLAGAVRPDHADDARRRQREAQVLEQQPVAEALRQPSASITTSPRRGPGGMWISTRVELDALLLGEQLLVRAETRLRLRVARASGSSAPTRARAASVRRRADACFSSTASRACFCSSQRRVVALERDAPAAVELEDPAGDVVEEVPVVRDRDDGALVVGEEALEPDRPTRRRGGSSARRAAAGRATRAAAGRARRAGARRPTASSRRGRLPAGAARPSRGRACASSSRRRGGRSASCTFACSASSASKSASGSANCAEIALKRSSRSRTSRTPSSTFPRTSFVGIELRLLLEQADRRVRRQLGDAATTVSSFPP